MTLGHRPITSGILYLAQCQSSLPINSTEWQEKVAQVEPEVAIAISHRELFVEFIRDETQCATGAKRLRFDRYTRCNALDWVLRKMCGNLPSQMTGEKD